MSYKRRNKSDTDYEMEIMSIKIEQLEKRLDLLEKTIGYMEKSIHYRDNVIGMMEAKLKGGAYANIPSTSTTESEPISSSSSEISTDKEEGPEMALNGGNHEHPKHGMQHFHRLSIL